ncbi:hypothetical protein M9H77_30230 [Catharanthus roseus]|uniref:Uncharacterized protein n=1 Tax=Catharanthus roseus TaxID=4058 RepID=A0ACB9ZYY8_CATRO|nr:hypothetical protein M9H77_30230 [Catharanthus roseus]
MGHTPSQLGNIPRTFSTRSERSYISPLIEDKDYMPYRVSTSQVSERDEHNHHVEKVFKTKKKYCKSITVKQINQIIEQQNYTNIYLNVLGEQILSLHKRIDLLLKKLDKSSSPDSSGKKVVIATPPLQPPPEIKNYKLQTMSDLETLIEQKF